MEKETGCARCPFRWRRAAASFLVVGEQAILHSYHFTSFSGIFWDKFIQALDVLHPNRRNEDDDKWCINIMKMHFKADIIIKTF
jgi:hypothetical protein